MLERALPKVQRWRSDDIYTTATLLPFLYCTSTIQRRQYARVRSAVAANSRRKDEDGQGPRMSRGRGSDRNDAKTKYLNSLKERTLALQQEEQDGLERQSQRSLHAEENVPFGDSSDEQRAGFDLDKSTITPRERQTFEKLFSLQKQAKTPTQSAEKAVQKHKKSKTGLDAILDSAVANIHSRGRAKPKFPDALIPMAEEARDKQQLIRLTHAETDSKRSKETKRDYDHVTNLMTSAPTDLDTWKILKGLVLNRVAALKLDDKESPYQAEAGQSWEKTEKNILKQRAQQKKAANKPSKSTDDPNLSELQILTANLPAHLHDFLAHMSATYPTSPLPLNLLPTLKKLGPSAFALAASTSLYNSHLLLLHTHHPTTVNALVEVLEEMDREVYAFDDQSLEIVEKVLKTLNGYRHGHSGKAIQILFSSERVARGCKGLMEWRGVMLLRRQEDALRKARKGMDVVAAAAG